MDASKLTAMTLTYTKLAGGVVVDLTGTLDASAAPFEGYYRSVLRSQLVASPEVGGLPVDPSTEKCTVDIIHGTLSAHIEFGVVTPAPMRGRPTQVARPARPVPPAVATSAAVARPRGQVITAQKLIDAVAAQALSPESLRAAQEAVQRAAAAGAAGAGVVPAPAPVPAAASPPV